MTLPDGHLSPVGPVFLTDLFPGLHAELMALLRRLDENDWAQPTACALWSVKDIVAHLLDGNVRRLSCGRDGLKPEPNSALATYSDLVAYLDQLNAEWTSAARRLSHRVLMELLDFTAREVHGYFRSLDPYQPSLFAVAWAGEDASLNWFDIGREYTERWLHQQQIREAVGAPGLTRRGWLHPALDIFVRALPFTYRQVDAEIGLSIGFEISGEAGGVWTLVRYPEDWRLFIGATDGASARVRMDQGTAWKLFSKGLSGEAARRNVRIEGDPRLGGPALGALAVMA